MSKTGLKFYPETRKKNEISQRIPLYMRITKDGKKAEARLECDLEEKEVTLWNQQLGRVNVRNCQVNDYLNAIEEAFMHFKIINATSMGKYSASEIRDILLNKKGNEKQISILDYANKYYKNNLEKSTKFTEGTKKNYRKALRHLEAFIHTNRLEHETLKDLNYEFARNFSNYLMSDHEDRKGMSEASACGMIKKFRTIFNEAIETELITKNPFKAIKLSYKSPEKPKLSLNHLHSLFSGGQMKNDEKKAISIFQFMTLTGCAYQDCMDLTSENLEISEQGVKLRYNRNKTGLESMQFLVKPAIQLLQDFQKSPDVSAGEFLVPRISNQHMNRMLRIIAAKYNVHLALTCHTARHSYRSLLDEADIVDPAVIRKLMGWSDRGSIDAIYRKVTDSRLIKTKDELDKLLDRILK